MYQVVLVDDDKLVTKFLEKMISWEDHGFKVVASFQGSLEAYEYLLSHPYDVLITDIGMPHMNGVELISKIKEHNSSSYNVILSCHDEFHFAQQAIKLKTFDYLLKETMEEKDIIELLRRLKQSLDQTKQDVYQRDKIKSFLRNNQMSLKTNFLEKIIHEPHVKQDEWWKEQEELLGIDFSHESYSVILCYIDQFKEAITRYKNETLLQFSINNVMEESLTKYEHGVQLFYLHKKIFILYPASSAKLLIIHRTLERALGEIQSKLRSYLRLSITCVIHPGCQERDEIKVSMQELINNEEQRFYYPYGTIQPFRKIDYQKVSIFEKYATEVDQVKTAILMKDKEKLNEWLANKLEEKKMEQHTPKAINDWVMLLTLDIKVSLNALQHFENQSIYTITSQRLQETENYQELQLLLTDIFHEYIEQAKILESISGNEEIIKAKKYVYSHFNNKITLKDMSSHLHLNPSYFSRLFKQETGETFIEFVTRIKMEKAMGLLDNSTKTVEQISLELGFDSKSYFVKTFKKFVGISPKTYKYKKDYQPINE
ncbi:helix-turn-helix domain-containing protein [Halalkalibacter sp. APA_J-10(15)]|uniref:response regulator n=1 Tax=Halalkalibacter sp. APA_J-10(15) TaxID=2933805 RepID=UPI001FF6E49F|nr:helix-turn-helix domain-containing protein [Halalkalibacter sp. APA_J-10(15)]MCK0473204.1 response regulator [Halalkalibacter sp. APA_J-10(15)]